MSALFKYSDYVARNYSDTKTDVHTHAFFTTPLSFGGKVVAENRVYLTLEAWVKAHMLWLDCVEGIQRPSIMKKHAASVLKELDKMDAPDEGYELMLRCVKYAPHHGNSAYPATVYHTDGRTASGTLYELEAATGLPYNKIRDLIHNRLRYYGGWCGKEAEAKRGKLKAGRKPRKRTNVAMETEGTHFF